MERWIRIPLFEVLADHRGIGQRDRVVDEDRNAANRAISRLLGSGRDTLRRADGRLPESDANASWSGARAAPLRIRA
jgi:hypothetical protein